MSRRLHDNDSNTDGHHVSPFFLFPSLKRDWVDSTFFQSRIAQGQRQVYRHQGLLQFQMAGTSSRPSRPAPFSPSNIDDPFESTAVPGAEQCYGEFSASSLTASKGLDPSGNKDLENHGHLSRASALASWRSTPLPKKKARKQWNGEYLYLSTPRRGPRLERVSPIPLEYDQPIAETTPSASSDEFEPDIASPLFQKSVEALRREDWGKTFQQQKTSNDASSSEAETEILEADFEAGARLSGLPESAFSARNEPSLAFLDEPSTAREFDAGVLLGMINFNTTSASGRSFNSRCLVSRITLLKYSNNDRAHSTTATPHTAVQAYKATGLVREVDIHTPSSTKSSSSNLNRLTRKPKFEVQRDAAKLPTKHDASKGNDGRHPTVLKDKTNLPLRIRNRPRQSSPDALKQKPRTANHKLQESQHSLPDALKAGFIKESEPTESPVHPATAIKKPIPSIKPPAILGSSHIPQPSPLSARPIKPSKRTHKPKVRLPEYDSRRILSPDHAQAISHTLAVLERRAPPNPPPDSPPLVRYARRGKEGYTDDVRFDQDELVLHQPMPRRGKMAMKKVVERFERMAMDAEEEVTRQQDFLEVGGV